MINLSADLPACTNQIVIVLRLPGEQAARLLNLGYALDDTGLVQLTLAVDLFKALWQALQDREQQVHTHKQPELFRMRR